MLWSVDVWWMCDGCVVDVWWMCGGCVVDVCRVSLSTVESRLSSPCKILKNFNAMKVHFLLFKPPQKQNAGRNHCLRHDLALQILCLLLAVA